jgi:hypothetical protein
MTIPKAFISYSHDSQEHRKWVLEFATRLRNSGIDAILDQWELQPGDDIPHFMERNLESADRVLMVCTDRYVERSNAGAGGVGYEKMIVTADLMKRIDSNKVIPIIRQTGTHNVPTFLKSKLFIDFSRAGQEEYAFDELLRTLHGAPLFKKPPVGNKPFAPVADNLPEQQVDPVLELMRIVVLDYETHTEDYVDYSTVLTKSGFSRLMLEVLIEKAKREGLITQDGYKDIYLTDNGKEYAIDHKLNQS